MSLVGYVQYKILEEYLNWKLFNNEHRRVHELVSKWDAEGERLKRYKTRERVAQKFHRILRYDWGYYCCPICGQALVNEDDHPKCRELDDELWEEHRDSDAYWCTNCGQPFDEKEERPWMPGYCEFCRLRQEAKVDAVQEEPLICPACGEYFTEDGCGC